MLVGAIAFSSCGSKATNATEEATTECCEKKDTSACCEKKDSTCCEKKDSCDKHCEGHNHSADSTCSK